jgi:nucleoside-diphosphate-sugar epimerase
MKKQRLLITGVNGMIGRILAGSLRRAYLVYGMDNRGPFSGRVFKTDIADLDQVLECLRRIGEISCILHLAGQSSVEASWDAILEANIVGTRNIYEAARINGVQRVVFASSNHVTGGYEGLEPRLHLEAEPEMITVRHPIRPDSDYGVSKALGEALARYYCLRWGIESVCLRIGSVLPNDDPGANARFAKTWLSHRDLIQLIEKSITAPVSFGIYYGVSNNRGRFWDISNAEAELGFDPVDEA